MKKNLPQKIIEKLLKAQESEITEHYIYKKLATKTKVDHNANVLKQIAEDELKHYHYWRKYTHQEITPNQAKITKFYWITRILGLTFGVKLMEKGEQVAQVNYHDFLKYIPESAEVIKDEEKHENDLINCINEEKLEYVGSVVLGLNDALVEITGTLAGLTFALQNTRLVGIAGLITGIAASLSMAASEYLSNRADENDKALTSATYTFIAYVITVILLIIPFFIFIDYLLALITTLLVVILVIFAFNFYISVAKNYSFKKRFLEMAAISLGVATLSFIIGYLIRIFLNIEV